MFAFFSSRHVFFQMMCKEMGKDSIPKEEWPTDAQIKWQNKQARPKGTGLDYNLLGKILVKFLHLLMKIAISYYSVLYIFLCAISVNYINHMVT